MKKAVITFLLFYCSCCCYCQWSVMPDEIKKSIVSACPVCSRLPADSSRILNRLQGSEKTAIDYHNCHVFYKQDVGDSAFKYSLYLLSELGNNIQDRRCKFAFLIKARILYDKNLAKQSLSEFLNLLKAIPEDDEINGYLNILVGSNYAFLEDYANSLPYLLKGVNHQGIRDLKNLKDAYNNIGICYLFFKKESDAKTYFGKSISIAGQLKDTVNLARLYNNIAIQYYSKYEDKIATRYFKQALSYALQTNDPSIKELTYKNISAVYENNKDYQAALNHRKLYEAQHDSVYNRDKVWITAGEKNRLDSELYARKIQVGEQARKLQSLELNKRSLEIGRQKQQLYIAVFASVAFLSFFIFALYAYRQKNRQNQIITAQREQLDALNHTKDQLFSVVAHDLRSPVQTLRVALNKLKTALHHKNISEAEQVSGDVEGIANGTYSLLNNLLYWALSQTGQLHFAKEKLNLCRLAEQVLYDYNPVAAAKNVKLENQIPESLYGAGDMNTVKIILRNLTDNAIKFSEPFTSIILSGKETENECILSVTNSGKPINEAVVQALNNKNTRRVESEQKQSTGIGLWLVKTMAERNGGGLYIDKLANGTTINIRLPRSIEVAYA